MAAVDGRVGATSLAVGVMTTIDVRVGSGVSVSVVLAVAVLVTRDTVVLAIVARVGKDEGVVVFEKLVGS